MCIVYLYLYLHIIYIHNYVLLLLPEHKQAPVNDFDFTFHSMYQISWEPQL